jgi:hypothetical protein
VLALEACEVVAAVLFGLARVSGDVPSCALMLILASFCAVRASLQPVRPHGAAPQPAGRRASLEVVPVTR